MHSLYRTHVPEGSVEEQWDLAGSSAHREGELMLSVPVREWAKNEPNLSETMKSSTHRRAVGRSLFGQIELVGAENFHQFERNVMLQSLDTHWREHLAALDHLRQGIHLRGYAQNPKQEYKREAFELFENLLEAVRNDVTRLLVTVQVRSAEQMSRKRHHADVQNVQYHHADYDEALGGRDAEQEAAQQLARLRPRSVQRCLPLRFRQEVQALPRQVGLISPATAGPETQRTHRFRWRVPSFRHFLSKPGSERVELCP